MFSFSYLFKISNSQLPTLPRRLLKMMMLRCLIPSQMYKVFINDVITIEATSLKIHQTRRLQGTTRDYEDYEDSKCPTRNQTWIDYATIIRCDDQNKICLYGVSISLSLYSLFFPILNLSDQNNGFMK
jgi:hypothetical protein